MAPLHCYTPMSPKAMVALVLSALIIQVAALPRQGKEGTTLNVEANGIVSSNGDMIRRQAPPATGVAADLAQLREEPEDEDLDITKDGPIVVAAAAQSESEETKLEELTEECMQDEPTSECMEKFGSYGVRKLYTETWGNIVKLGYLQPGWMSHPQVQKKKLFEVTLPGSANSGTYAISGQNTDSAVTPPFGAVSQNFNFYKQLELGVRSFDIKVAYDSENKLVFISHGELMVPLGTALRDLRRFLEEHEREVVVLDVRKDDKADISRTQALIDEETATGKVPGQLVHEAVMCELTTLVATHEVLSKLPAGVVAENPTIGELTDIGAQVIYFYEGQQVLCKSHEECLKTPGWMPSDPRLGQAFGFGPPQILGSRGNLTSVTNKDKKALIIEPACQVHSSFYTQDYKPEALMKKIAIFTKDLNNAIQFHHPTCYPAAQAPPIPQKPTLWYSIDGFVTTTAEEQQKQSELMRGVDAIYTRGEGFTVKSDAERTNYLMLTWFLRKSNQNVYTKPNTILFEYVGSAMMPIARLIEAEQKRPECGWAFYCKESGSCWAHTLLGLKEMCIPEAAMVEKLKEHVDGKVDTTKWVIYTSICLLTVLVVGCLVQFARWYIKTFRPKPPKEGEEGLVADGEEAGEEDAEEDADGLREAGEGEEPQEIAA